MADTTRELAVKLTSQDSTRAGFDSATRKASEFEKGLEKVQERAVGVRHQLKELFAGFSIAGLALEAIGRVREQFVQLEDALKRVTDAYEQNAVAFESTHSEEVVARVREIVALHKEEAAEMERLAIATAGLEGWERAAAETMIAFGKAWSGLPTAVKNAKAAAAMDEWLPKDKGLLGMKPQEIDALNAKLQAQANLLQAAGKSLGLSADEAERLQKALAAPGAFSQAWKVNSAQQDTQLAALAKVISESGLKEQQLFTFLQPGKEWPEAPTTPLGPTGLAQFAQQKGYDPDKLRAKLDELRKSYADVTTEIEANAKAQRDADEASRQWLLTMNSLDQGLARGLDEVQTRFSNFEIGRDFVMNAAQGMSQAFVTAFDTIEQRGIRFEERIKQLLRNILTAFQQAAYQAIGMKLSGLFFGIFGGSPQQNVSTPGNPWGGVNMSQNVPAPPVSNATYGGGGGFGSAKSGVVVNFAPQISSNSLDPSTAAKLIAASVQASLLEFARKLNTSPDYRQAVAG